MTGKDKKGVIFENDPRVYKFGILDMGIVGLRQIQIHPNHKKTEKQPDFVIKLENKNIGGFWQVSPHELSGNLNIWPLGLIKIIANRNKEKTNKNPMIADWSIFLNSLEES